MSWRLPGDAVASSRDHQSPEAPVARLPPAWHGVEAPGAGSRLSPLFPARRPVRHVHRPALAPGLRGQDQAPEQSVAHRVARARDGVRLRRRSRRRVSPDSRPQLDEPAHAVGRAARCAGPALAGRSHRDPVRRSHSARPRRGARPHVRPARSLSPSRGPSWRRGTGETSRSSRSCSCSWRRTCSSTWAPRRGPRAPPSWPSTSSSSSSW